MSDIFISYSRKDSEQALSLAERFRLDGMSVWIDQQGIEAAKTWSGEIVDAIDQCKAFVVLLSDNSVDSRNVTKEVGIACEANKRILPIALHDVKLNSDLRYHLSGIQRVAFAESDAIGQALRSFGIESTHAKPASNRKSLMVLPFEDISPTADNGWFTDGMASELIGVLSHVKSLRVIDWNTSKLLKERKVRTTDLAKELDVRYFIEGQVRKFGDQIRISITLLDIQTGEHLWHNSFKGVMADVFEIQEHVATSVVDGLRLHLGSQEHKKMLERGTASAEVYELFLKAVDHFRKQTQKGYLLAVQMLDQAIEQDPQYSQALNLKSLALCELYRSYQREPKLLAEAEQLSRKALRIDPGLHRANQALASALRQQGRVDEAREVLENYMRLAPESWDAHFALAYLNFQTHQHALAIAGFERVLALRPDHLAAYSNLLACYRELKDTVREKETAQRSIPHYERYLRLAPDDEREAANFAIAALSAGETEKAIATARHLLIKGDLDGVALYNMACLFVRLQDSSHALDALRKAKDAGLDVLTHMRTDPDLDPLRELPEFKALMQNLEEKQDNV